MQFALLARMEEEDHSHCKSEKDDDADECELTYHHNHLREAELKKTQVAGDLTQVDNTEKTEYDCKGERTVSHVEEDGVCFVVFVLLFEGENEPRDEGYQYEGIHTYIHPVPSGAEVLAYTALVHLATGVTLV